MKAACTLLVLAVMAGGAVLSRLDMQRKETAAIAAQLRQTRAELRLLDVELHRLAAGPVVVRDEVARRRLEALKSELLALVRRGKAEIEGGPAWAAWGFE